MVSLVSHRSAYGMLVVSGRRGLRTYGAPHLPPCTVSMLAATSMAHETSRGARTSFGDMYEGLGPFPGDAGTPDAGCG